jgi:Flp pilus assembly protein TadD
MINDIGYYCLQNEIAEAAIVVFRFNVDRFPCSWNANDSLGEALVAVGRDTEAEACFRKALELNPRFASSRASLEKLLRE